MGHRSSNPAAGARRPLPLTPRPPGALQAVRVPELAQIVAGALCGTLMAELGAPM